MSQIDVHVESHDEPCEVIFFYKLFFFFFKFGTQMGVWDLWKTPSLNENNLL
jgi:hypothetical protein